MKISRDPYGYRAPCSTGCRRVPYGIPIPPGTRLSPADNNRRAPAGNPVRAPWGVADGTRAGTVWACWLG